MFAFLCHCLSFAGAVYNNCCKFLKEEIHIKIFIDAGHNFSGHDTGSTGFGIKEQDVTYNIATILKELLLDCGFEVLCSRNNLKDNLGKTLNESIALRSKMANDWGADYFISLHCDASNNHFAKGAHICICGKGGKAEKLANKLMPYLLNLGLEGRSEAIKVRTDLSVLNNTKMPSILIEMGFITNEANAMLLKNNQNEIAKAILNGICEFAGVKINTNDVNIRIENMQINAKGKLIDSKTYIPIRDVLELLGYKIEWDEKTKTVNITGRGGAKNE